MKKKLAWLVMWFWIIAIALAIVFFFPKKVAVSIILTLVLGAAFVFSMTWAINHIDGSAERSRQIRKELDEHLKNLDDLVNK